MSKKSTEKELARSLLDTLFMVVHAVAAEMRRTAPVGFEPAQLRVLALLSKHPRILKELAACQQVAQPTMSRTISSLVDRGWVERVIDPQDRRQVLVRITDKGLTMLHELRNQAQHHLTKKLATLTDEERYHLQVSLDILKKIFATEDAYERY